MSASLSYAEALRRLGLCATGGNGQTLRRWVERWAIPTDHFDPSIARRQALQRSPQPLERILVEYSTYSRNHLKHRLYEAGVKRPICEICGQGGVWRGARMSLILDHINGVRDDNRIENLRIVCPNCAATFDTHCGRKNRATGVRDCSRCGKPFIPKSITNRYCSRACGVRNRADTPGVANPKLRRVERPAYDELRQQIATTSFSAVGRNYGVSDNAIRKWVRQYEREDACRAAGSVPDADVVVTRADRPASQAITTVCT